MTTVDIWVGLSFDHLLDALTKFLKSFVLQLLFNIIIWGTDIIFNNLTLKDINKADFFYLFSLTSVLGSSIAFSSLILLFFSFLE